MWWGDVYEAEIDGLDLFEAGKEDQNSVGGLSLNRNRRMLHETKIDGLVYGPYPS